MYMCMYMCMYMYIYMNIYIVQVHNKPTPARPSVRGPWRTRRPSGRARPFLGGESVGIEGTLAD